MIQSFAEGVDPSFIKAAISDDTVIILWLVGFNVFQGILIILILVLCTNQRAKYKRRLKAATIGNSVISDTLLRNRAQPVMQVNDKPGGPGSGKVMPSNNVPNTNKHATQGNVTFLKRD